MGEQRLLSPEELAVLFKRLDALIAEARTLQEHITDRLATTRRPGQLAFPAGVGTGRNSSPSKRPDVRQSAMWRKNAAAPSG